MTAATYTSTLMTAPVKSHVYGTTIIRGQAKWTAAGSVTDILQLARVPHGAKIVDFYEYHTNGQTAAVLDFGFSKGIAAGGAGNNSCIVSGGALATMNRLSLAAAPGNLPITISLSDTDPVRYTVLQALAVSGTFTISVVVNFMLSYTTDGPDGAP